MSIVIVATAYPLPEHRDEVTAAFAEVIEQVHAQDRGCELYALHEGRDRLVMIEKWTDKEALTEHSQGAGLAALTTRLDGLLCAPLDVQVLKPHPAGTTGQGTL